MQSSPWSKYWAEVEAENSRPEGQRLVSPPGLCLLCSALLFRVLHWRDLLPVFMFAGLLCLHGLWGSLLS